MRFNPCFSGGATDLRSSRHAGDRHTDRRGFGDTTFRFERFGTLSIPNLLGISALPSTPIAEFPSIHGGDREVSTESETREDTFRSSISEASRPRGHQNPEPWKQACNMLLCSLRVLRPRSKIGSRTSDRLPRVNLRGLRFSLGFSYTWGLCQRHSYESECPQQIRTSWKKAWSHRTEGRHLFERIALLFSSASNQLHSVGKTEFWLLRGFGA